MTKAKYKIVWYNYSGVKQEYEGVTMSPVKSLDQLRYELESHIEQFSGEILEFEEVK